MMLRCLHSAARIRLPALSTLFAFVIVGCGKSDVPTASPMDSLTDAMVLSASQDSPQADVSKKTPIESSIESQADEEFNFAPLAVNQGAASQSDTADQQNEPSAAVREQQIQAIIEKLQPLQILLGRWRGTTRRDYDGFKAVDSHEWIWDLRSHPQQPALVAKSDKSPHLRSARLTWDTALQKFELTGIDGDDVVRKYLGDFTEPVHEVVGSDDKLHQVFRLEFNQQESIESADDAPTELWQIAFAQQENNRYLLEVSRRRGKAEFRRYDTVSTQREGTSFAKSDATYAEKTCIISEGLGTIELTYKGRSYWVCCTGCKAAFEEDPETWIARAAKRPAPQ